MDDQVSRARELLAAVTPGPWEVHGDYGIWSDGAGVWVMQDDCLPGGTLGGGDAALIAAAPTLLAELADEVDRLQAALHLRDTTPRPPENAMWHWSLISNSDYTKVCAENARLRARLDAVLAIHSDRNGDCAECEMSTGQGVSWPCWTYEAALGVE